MTSLGLRSVYGIGLLLAGALLGLGAAVAPDVLHVGHFLAAVADSSGHPEQWDPITLSKVEAKTRYRLVQPSGQGTTGSVVRATSDGGASGLVRRMRIDPHRHPILTWRWRVSNVLEQGDATEKDGDDYPARIYVLFDYDPSNLGFFDRVKYKTLKALGYDEIPTRALNYIWANRVEEGTFVENPYTDWVQMMPVESGSAKVGTWVTERRNVASDYREAFGEEPPPIAGIAIMTDTDNTGESATTYYGDITLRARAAAKRIEAANEQGAPPFIRDQLGQSNRWSESE